jgi:hypothetical protein
MERSCDELLAGAVLPEDQDPGLGRRNASDLLEELSHRGRRADHVAVRLELFAQPTILFFQGRLPQGVAGGQKDLFGVRRLLHEVERPEPGGLDGGLDGAVRGQEHDRHVELPAAQLAEGPHAVELGHLEVQDDEIDPPSLDGLESLASILDTAHLVAVEAERHAQARSDVLFVVGDQHGLHR